MEKIPTLKLNSNHSVPVIGCGTFQIAEATKLALDCGYRHFDTAYLYGTEGPLGNCFKKLFEEGKLKREDLFITTKMPCNGMRPCDISKFAHLSLQELMIDSIDLYLLHHPFGVIGKSNTDFFPRNSEGLTPFVSNVDIEGIWKEMEKLVDEGLVKSIGVSNFNSEQIHRLAKFARIMPAVNQVEAYLYLQQHELNKICKMYDIKIMAFGALGAPYREGGINKIPSALNDPAVKAMAAKKNKTPAQIALRFLVQLGYAVIPKSSNEKRLKENLQIFDFQLNQSEMNELLKLDKGPNGRMLTYREIWPGIEKSPHYPFHIPF